MSTMSKVFVVLNLVLSLFLVGTLAAILSHGEDWKAKYDSEAALHKKDKDADAQKFDALNGEKQNTDKANRDLINQKQDVESQLQAMKATADQVRNDNNQLRTAIDSINASLKSVQGELADAQAHQKSLMESNESLKKETADAKKAQMDAEDDRARIEGDLKRATDDVAEKERQLKTVTDARDQADAKLTALTKLGVQVDQLIGNNVPLIEGKVSDVAKDGSFVVLSVGDHESVKIGYAFDVYRGNDYIGRVVVDNVLPDSSTARVTMRNQKGLDFKAMDSATTRL